MYRTCLHCHRPLGDNDVVEHFPVGKRLAYDAAKGRLWVVCWQCQRWNLTPLEERWEAIEECEREFERTRMRASTDTIAIARTRSGLELVRIGAPTYREFAAWRYGRILGERWRRAVVPSTGLLTAIYSVQVMTSGAGFVPALAVIGALGLGVSLPSLPAAIRGWRTKVRFPDGKVAQWSEIYGRGVELEPDGPSAWALRLSSNTGTVRATGTDAVHAARGMLAMVNAAGGRRPVVEAATSLVGEAENSGGLVAKIALAARRHAQGNINMLPPEVRLGLEMALHEDTERAALAGELNVLSEEWKRAEELADIADNLFLPASVSKGLARLRGERP